MKFTLSADGAQAAGQGIGNIFKAYVMGPQVRQQAEQDAVKSAADIYYRKMMGDKSGAEAGKLGQETEGLRLTNAARTSPIDDTLPANLQTAYKLFQATGDNNMERFANAGTAIQTQGIREQAVANVGDIDLMNRYSTLAKPGEVYTPFSAVGSTGRALNQATGEGATLDATLAKLFDTVQRSAATENFAQANSANASAGNSSASARLTLERLGILKDTGSLPGAGGSGEDATNAKSRNAIIAAVEREMPASSDAEIMAEVEKRLARRGINGNKNPAPGVAAPKIGAIENGYRFKGGDPASSSSWEKVR